MKTEEEKANELYPDKEYPDVFGLNMEQLHERSIEHQQILMQRKAFLKGYEYANKQPEVEICDNCGLNKRIPIDTVTQICVCSLSEKQPQDQDKVREAAEKVVYEWHNSVGEECIDAAMVKLVKVLNQNKDE